MYPVNKAKILLPLIDLTRLNDSDTPNTIEVLCQQAIRGSVAAVCVYPHFVKLSKELLHATSIKIATVANFPHGTDSLESVSDVISKALEEGADEVDIVFPYQHYLAGQSHHAYQFIEKCKLICRDKLLKVILETGALNDPEVIALVSRNVILSGADFLKTSTGKIEIGATVSAAEKMLQAIKDSKLAVGFKVSGGIRTINQAESYLELVRKILGEEWLAPRTFRVGASKLIEELLRTEESGPDR